jgi:hypothetical protein
MPKTFRNLNSSTRLMNQNMRSQQNITSILKKTNITMISTLRRQLINWKIQRSHLKRSFLSIRNLHRRNLQYNKPRSPQKRSFLPRPNNPNRTISRISKAINPLQFLSRANPRRKTTKSISKNLKSTFQSQQRLRANLMWKNLLRNCQLLNR